MKNRQLYIITVIVLISVLSLTGCNDSKLSTIDGVTQLSFADTVSIDQIKKLDGKTVSIVGFMSQTSPLDGSYFYLMNMPYQTCPFCLPNTNTLANTIAVYAPQGQSFRFQDIPLKVTGQIKVEDITDDIGYSYSYRIVDAKVERAEVSGLGREIRVYTELVDKGFANDFTSVIEDVYVAINHEEFEMEVEEVEAIDLSGTTQLKAMFDGLNPADYQDIIDVVERLEDLINRVNTAIESEDWETLYSLGEEAEAIYFDFRMWLIKPSI